MAGLEALRPALAAGGSFPAAAAERRPEPIQGPPGWATAPDPGHRGPAARAFAGSRRSSPGHRRRAQVGVRVPAILEVPALGGATIVGSDLHGGLARANREGGRPWSWHPNGPAAGGALLLGALGCALCGAVLAVRADPGTPAARDRGLGGSRPLLTDEKDSLEHQRRRLPAHGRPVPLLPPGRRREALRARLFRLDGTTVVPGEKVPLLPKDEVTSSGTRPTPRGSRRTAPSLTSSARTGLIGAASSSRPASSCSAFPSIRGPGCRSGAAERSAGLRGLIQGIPGLEGARRTAAGDRERGCPRRQHRGTCGQGWPAIRRLPRPRARRHRLRASCRGRAPVRGHRHRSQAVPDRPWAGAGSAGPRRGRGRVPGAGRPGGRPRGASTLFFWDGAGSSRSHSASCDGPTGRRQAGRPPRFG